MTTLDQFGDLLGAAERTDICLASLPGFIPAKQVRSQKKVDRIVSTAAHLLQKRSFCDISVHDIAHMAGCAVTAIYARFHDKDALLPAIHLIVLEHDRHEWRARFRPKDYKAGDFDRFCQDFVLATDAFFIRNRYFFEAALGGHQKYIFEQAHEYNVEQSALFGPLVRRLLKRRPCESLAELEFAIHMLKAILRDRIISGAHSGMTDPAALARLFATVVQQDVVERPGRP